MAHAALHNLVDLEGLALLRERLRVANAANPLFEVQFARLVDVLAETVRRLDREVGAEIKQVRAVGDWAREGIDLRILPCDDITVLIVVRLPERPFELYLRIADRVFAGLGDEDIGVQFGLETQAEWQAKAETARRRGSEDALGIPLFMHA